MIYIHWELINLFSLEKIFFSEYQTQLNTSIEITVELRSYLYSDLCYKETFIFPKECFFELFPSAANNYWEIAYNKKKWIKEKFIEIEKRHNGENFINEENWSTIEKIEKYLQEYDQILFKEKVDKHYGTIASIGLREYNHKNKKHKKYKKTSLRNGSHLTLYLLFFIIFIILIYIGERL